MITIGVYSSGVDIKPLIRPYFWGGYVRIMLGRGGRLTSHDYTTTSLLHFFKNVEGIG